MQKILTIIGARPQFIKASVVSRAISQTEDLKEVLLHTGQHFDANMSDIFFNELGIPKPNYLLDINGGSHGEMTGRMLIEIEKILREEKPDRVLVYGDTNSTLAGALAASKLHIPVAHIEAGLRSFNMKMPEEVNRILTDQLSDILFCPTDVAVRNLGDEGFELKKANVLKVGDVMQDSAIFFSKQARKPQNVKYENNFVLATIHRAENTDDLTRLRSIIEALNEIHRTVAPVVLPIHPRTKNIISSLGIEIDVDIVEPVGYLEMIWLLKHSGLVLTDSGGVQKEAYFFSVPCVTMRDQTEWVELVDCGANTLVGADKNKIIFSAKKSFGKKITANDSLYGGGKASQNIVKVLAM